MPHRGCKAAGCCCCCGCTSHLQHWEQQLGWHQLPARPAPWMTRVTLVEGMMVLVCQGWGRLLLSPPQVQQQCPEWEQQQQRLQDTANKESSRQAQ